MTDQRALRRQLKHLRSSIAPRTRAQAQAAALRHVLHHWRFRKANRIAAYVGAKGEIDPMPLLEQAALDNKRCYLPVLHPFRAGRLWFCRWRPGDRLVNNRFGIPEPLVRPGHMIAARDLDLVIVPLLGFDHACNRLGMGGGFYDRTFAFMRHHVPARGPYLLGLAHELQRIDSLRNEPWDVPLDAVATEQRIYFRRIKNGI